MRQFKSASCLMGYVFFMLLCSCQFGDEKTNDNLLQYPKALVSYGDYKNLVATVEDVRIDRLINLDIFLKYQQEQATVVLDTRSREFYNLKHVKGAINLPFTEFTQQNLSRLIPDPNTRILIYCNNNFKGDQVAFASKSFNPKLSNINTLTDQKKPTMLALNVPTYINLYGYGYRNIYELNELVNVTDKRINFESYISTSVDYKTSRKTY